MPAAPPLLETPESWHTNGHNAEASNGLSALPLPTPHASMPPPRFDQGRSSRISRQAFLMLSCIGREVLKELEPQMLQLKDPLRPTSVPAPHCAKGQEYPKRDPSLLSWNGNSAARP